MIDMKDYVQRAREEGNFLVTGYSKNERKIIRMVEPSYELGYVFGSYLSIGSVNLITYKNSTRGMVFWYIERGVPEEKVEKLGDSLHRAFNLNMITREQKKSSTYQAVCYSKPLAELLSELGKKSGRKTLPDAYLYKSREYRQGLLHGIEDFNGHKPDSRNVINKRKINVSIIELYNNLKMY